MRVFLSLIVFILSSAVMAQSNLIVKDADGRILPKEGVALLGMKMTLEIKPRLQYGPEWKVLGGASAGIFDYSNFFIDRIVHLKNKTILTVILKTSEDQTRIITDVLLMKNLAETPVWGKYCKVPENTIPPGYLIGAVLDTKSKRRLNGKDGCDAPSYPARRAYLLELDTGKIKPFKTDPFWCVNEYELPCGS